MCLWNLTYLRILFGILWWLQKRCPMHIWCSWKIGSPKDLSEAKNVSIILDATVISSNPVKFEFAYNFQNLGKHALHSCFDTLRPTLENQLSTFGRCYQFDGYLNLIRTQAIADLEYEKLHIQRHWRKQVVFFCALRNVKRKVRKEKYEQLNLH